MSALVGGAAQRLQHHHVSGVSVAGGGQHLKVGHRYKVTISLGHQEITRTVELQKNTKESAVKKQLGY